MFNFMGGGNPLSNLGNMMSLVQMFTQFRNNPSGALMSMGINVPQNLQNSPEAIVNYLRNSGQMNDQQFNQFSNLAQQFQGFIGNMNPNMNMRRN